MATRTSLKRFIRQNGIRIRSKRTDHNPHMDDGGREMYHYKVRLYHDGKKMDLYFSMGLAHTEPPTAEDVLDCMASDSAGYQNARSFEDWCGEYGYDTDSRRAHRTFRQVERQASKLEDLLGPDLYEKLLWHTERL